MADKVLFIDRDGTLIREPADRQVDSLEKLELMPDVVPALLQLRGQGYIFVLVSNQDGRGTPAFPEQSFREPHEFLRRILASQGIEFAAEYICPHVAEAGCDCRKPRIGLVKDFISRCDFDRRRSFVIGDRASDMEFARNLGVEGLLIGERSWLEIAQLLGSQSRTARVERATSETEVRVRVDLDNGARVNVSTGIGLFDHMLEQIATHGGFSLELDCSGDLDICQHHTVEDTALALGQALREALGDKRGIGRYGFLLPMDDALAEVAVDLSGRPYFRFAGDFGRERVGQLPTELVPHFFRSLADSLRAAIHVSVRGDNAHHMVEATFKGVGRALRQGFSRSGHELPSTKGAL